MKKIIGITALVLTLSGCDIGMLYGDDGIIARYEYSEVQKQFILDSYGKDVLNWAEAKTFISLGLKKTMGGLFIPASKKGAHILMNDYYRDYFYTTGTAMHEVHHYTQYIMGSHSQISFDTMEDNKDEYSMKNVNFSDLHGRYSREREASLVEMYFIGNYLNSGRNFTTSDGVYITQEDIANLGNYLKAEVFMKS